MRCSACHTENAESAQFCMQCGARLNVGRSTVPAERRQITVLFCDLVGSTALSEELDPEDLRDVIRRYHSTCEGVVARYDGSIAQHLGDGVLVYFGHPRAHEDDAVRAVRAGLELRKAVSGMLVRARPLSVRVGIHTGVVVVGAVGAEARQLAIGATPNLAARIQQEAQPGTVLISETSHRVVSGFFRETDLGLRNVRGVTQEVHLYRVEGETGARSRMEATAAAGRGLTPLVARDSELQRLDAAWAQAELGRGRVVSITGEAGTGKTRLLHEFRQSVGAGGVVCEGSCFDHGYTAPYLPFRDILRSLFQLRELRSEADAAARVAKVANDLRLDSSLVLAPLLNVLSYSTTDKDFHALPANLVRERTVSALRAVVAAMAKDQPMVLVIEDLHWIDEATQEVVRGLVDDVEALKVLLVLVFRPEKNPEPERGHDSRSAPEELANPSSAELVRSIVKALVNRPHAVSVDLAPLSARLSAEMVAQLLDSKAIPPELEQLAFQATNGNPLFIEEFLRSLTDGGELRREGDHWILNTSPEALTLPRSLEGLFLSRVDRLDEELKKILRVASVIGRVFSPAVLAAALGGGHRLDAAIGDLEALDLVYRQSDTSPPTYSFKHVLSQRAVYKSLLRDTVREHHEKVGRAIESVYPDRLDEHCELLAFHYESSVHKDAPKRSTAAINKAVEYLHRANRKASAVSAMVDAQRYFQRAHNLFKELPGDARNDKRKLDLVLDQVFVALAVFTFREYHASLGEHASLPETLGDRGLMGAFHARVGWCQWAMGDFAEAIRTLDRAAADCRAAGIDDSRETGSFGSSEVYNSLGLALMTRAWCELDMGDFGPALLSCDASLRALERKFDLQSYLRTRAAATAVNAYLGRWDAALAEGRKAVEIGEQYGDGGLTSFAAMIMAWTYTFMGDLEQASVIADFAIKKAEVAKSPADTLFARGSRALVQCRMGQAAEAAEVLAGVVAVIRNMRFPACETFGLYYCEALWRAGDLAKARVALEECLGVVEPCGMRFYAACARRLLGEVELSEGGEHLSTAARHFEESMKVLEAVRAENELALARAGYGRLRMEIGDRVGARDYMVRALGAFERLGTRIEPDRIRHTLAELE